MVKNAKILLAGAGNIAEALIRGWLAAELVPAQNVAVMNRSNQEKLQWLSDTYGVQPVSDKGKAVRDCDILVLAVKPYAVLGFLESIQEYLFDRHIIVSVAAGISTVQMEEAAGRAVSVVRAMPNTATAVLESATAVSFGQYCTPEAEQLATVLLGAVGSLSVVEEAQMDTVTGLAGSGPAYVYYMVEAMQEAGLTLGLPEEVANELVVQTLYGAAIMLQQGELTAAELRERVTSPNGTTFAGLKVLAEGHLKELMLQAITKAKQRATELGQEVYDAAASRPR